MQMVRFDPHDNKISQILRERIEHWDTELPRLQHHQYGPFNKYLNDKFPDQMVKPQGLIRPIREGNDAVVDNYGLQDGDISMDSTGTLVENMIMPLPLTAPRRTIRLERRRETVSRFCSGELLQ